MRWAIAFMALVLIGFGGLLTVALGVPRASSTGSASPGGSLACSVKASPPGCDVGAGEVAVFRMSAAANAHAGTFGGSGYGNVLCCGGVHNLSAADCSAVYDRVATLSGTDNAHVAADLSYGTSVCLSVPHGVADCTYGLSCATDYQCLATVSGGSNAHIADCDGVGDYRTKLCCYVEDDNDNDGLLDPDDSDDDNDNLFDEVDVSPFTASTAFSDAALGGTTFGAILNTNGLTVEVREEPNPAGVRIVVAGSGFPATVSTCGTATLSLTNGDETVVTCGSATIEVLVGPIEATFGPFQATLPAGTTATIVQLAPGAFGVTNSPGSSGPITVNGMQIPPGGSEKDDDGDAFFTSIEQYLGTDSLDACPDVIGGDDAWPLDIDMTRDISVTGDVFNYRGRIGARPGDPAWRQRLDLDRSGDISVTGDVFKYRGKIGQSCT